MAATTIKIDSDLRDRLNALASECGLTAGSMVERLLEDYLWRQQIDLAKRQMREAPAEVWEEYLAETRTMEGSLADGLEDW